MTNAMPLFSGTLARKISNASNPPAEAPILSHREPHGWQNLYPDQCHNLINYTISLYILTAILNMSLQGGCFSRRHLRRTAFGAVQVSEASGSAVSNLQHNGVDCFGQAQERPRNDVAYFAPSGGMYFICHTPLPISVTSEYGVATKIHVLPGLSGI